MLFHTLTLRNFGPYAGQQSLELATSTESPVVLIFGENTLGKTQLFSALRWCLYGGFFPRQTGEAAIRELPSRLNLPARRRGDNELEVAIEFEAGGDTYSLRRKARFFKDGERAHVVPSLRINASQVAESDIEYEIGRVLHPQISEFFLFDAEMIESFYERLATERERALIRDSIETVLGVPALQLASRDVRDLSSDALNRQARLIENREHSTKIRKRLDEIASESSSIERDRSELLRQIAEAERELQEARDRLRVVDSLQADVRELETLEANIKDGEREEGDLENELRSTLASGWRSVAAGPLRKVLNEVRHANSEVVRRSQTITRARERVATLEDQFRGGTCPTCNQPLPAPGAETEAELQEARTELTRLLAETSGGTVDLERERRLGALIDDETIPRYVSQHRRLSRIRMQQYERQQRVDAIKGRLQGNSASEIRTVALRARTLETSLQDLRKASEKAIKRSESLSKEQARLARELDKLPGAAGSAIGIEAGFFRYVSDLLEGTIEAFRENVRFSVQKSAQELFLKLIRDPEGYGGLRIAGDYQIEILDRYGNSRGTSRGGEQLLALALIGALKRAAVRGGPVVVDSPLGRLDWTHRENVLQTWIPSLGSQSVLLVQSGELTMDRAKEILGSLIGRSYEIVRPNGDPEIAVIEKR